MGLEQHVRTVIGFAHSGAELLFICAISEPARKVEGLLMETAQDRNHYFKPKPFMESLSYSSKPLAKFCLWKCEADEAQWKAFIFLFS
ncbi:hypothetical protein QQF64_002863 [Cirrhinus molitorella]|uniref:Uncharacterized protein n=1 Tax=Cirrhinus molitorella TaxID=172907 RepID=A0ABR3MRC9_9TELE